jgi:hypothetical protein
MRFADAQLSSENPPMTAEDAANQHEQRQRVRFRPSASSIS